MANFVPARRTVTTALATLLATVTSRPIGSGVAPGSNGDVTVAAEAPYAIVYSIPGGAFTGPPLAYPEQDADFLYQITSVGLRQDQAEWMQDAVRHAILARNSNSTFLYPLVVAGLTVGDRQIAGGSGGITRSDLIYQGTEDYRIRIFG